MKMTTKGTVEEGWFPSRFVQPVNTGLTALAPKPPSAESKTFRKKEKFTNTTKEPKAPDAAGHVFVTITAGYNLKKKPGTFLGSFLFSFSFLFLLFLFSKEDDSSSAHWNPRRRAKKTSFHLLHEGN